ncbi:MAG TPA: heme lyase CcmF/NrfE family subunit [Geminicoccaceae bacterium]|nr:heme lyase CcmF/NrfE family subunit [Geminicoccaceae bacterium]
MIAEIGHYALVLALGLALVQGSAPFWGAARHDAALMELARTTALGQFLCLTLAFGALIQAFASSDFSVRLVADNSYSGNPLIYKIAAAWGNHEGSLVLWVWILALYGAGVALFGRNLPAPFRARVLGVQALIGVGFIAFMLFTSNPFVRLDPAPPDGQGFNPILQDPALAAHPPMLYTGYVGLSMAYAFAIAALIEGRVDASWARWVRPWTLAAWCALSFGIALGSYWAYYELGWGGWWFWDPVENASFMPWLAATALLHSAIVVEKRASLKSWTILLAILAFSLSLLGTFLVRSGVLTSVHAFAIDPARGVFILALLAVAIGGSLLLYAWRAPRLQGGGLFAPISREGGLLLNNLLLATACATVFLGTLYPLLLEALGGPKISVGPPYFDATFAPLMVPLLAAVPVGAMLAWKRADLAGVLGRLKAAFALTALVALVGLVLTRGSGVLAAGGMALAAWVVAGSLIELAGRVQLFRLPLAQCWQRAQRLPRSAYSMTLAHIGLGVVIAGITASSAWRGEAILVMQPGDTASLAGYSFKLEGIADRQGPNYVARRATFIVTRDGRPVATLTPERRFYPVERQSTSEAGIDTGFWRDLYVVLGDPAEGAKAEAGAHAVRIYDNPLVMWIWGGVAIMGIAGLWSLTDRRHRVGAPAAARARMAAAAARA